MKQVKGIVGTTNDLTDLVARLTAPPLISAEGKCVILDAGHGGQDSGAIGPNGTKEKDIALLVVMTIGQRLRDAGVKTILTRATDKFTTLADRVKLANRHDDANCFVSIHLNAANYQTVSGIEVFRYPKSYEGKILGCVLLKDLIDSFPEHKDRGLKEKAFYVLRHTRMPAALVELEFLSNPTQEAMFNDPDVLALYAEAISNGILQYLLSAEGEEVNESC